MTATAPPDTDAPPMATACPMQLIAAVTIEHVKHKGVIVDRRISIILDCGCRRELSVPLTVPAPRPGEPARCWGNHERES